MSAVEDEWVLIEYSDIPEISPTIKSTKFDIVAAIDIGTSLSGYAYSSSTEFIRNPLKIISEQCWNKFGLCKDETERKTASCILLNEEQKFESFGYDAQHRFAQLQSKKEEENYAFFQHFKMCLYEQKVPLQDLMIQDVREIVQVSAEKIFMYTIKAITDSLIEHMRISGLYTTIRKENIRWVITVPAIWDDRSKLFMRRCAILAGLPPEQILIALEAEAASIFCNYLKIQRPENITEGFVEPTTGTKYMVVDIGGGTTDITVHEKLENGLLKELNKSSGKGIGGTTVDEAFIKMIQDKLTGSVFTSLKNENPVVYLDLRKDLEEAKKSVTDEESDVFQIPINYSAIYSILKRLFNSSILKQITDGIVDENLLIDYATVKDLFKPTTDNVLSTVENALKFEGASEISMILLVGGFANCEIIERAIRNRFRTKRVIIPVDARSAVLQGAVLYGHKPEVICNRITKYTYGVGSQIPFQKYIHDPSRQFKRGKQVFCDNVFDTIVTRDQSVPRGTYLSRSYAITPNGNKHGSSIHIYESDRYRPEYIDEANCRKIGTVNITLPNIRDKQRIIDVHFLFGGTELKVMALDRESRQEFETTVVVA